MKKLLLLVGATALFVASTNLSHANVPPASTPMGDIIEISGLPEANGKYWRWMSGFNELGWLKQNPDGSSFQLIAKYSSTPGLSSTITSLRLFDTRTNTNISLLPSASSKSWVLSWVDSSFTIINRNHMGTYYGQKGIPGPTMVKEATGVVEDPSYDITLNLIKGPSAPSNNGSGSSLGTYQLTLLSNKDLGQGLEFVMDIDDSAGKTVFSRPIGVKMPAPTREFKQELRLDGPVAALPNGKYTLNIELRNMAKQREFLGGTTKVMDIRTSTKNVGSTIVGTNTAGATVVVGRRVPRSEVANATARLESIARFDFTQIANAERSELNKHLSALGHRHTIAIVNSQLPRSLSSTARGHSSSPRIDEVLYKANLDTLGILKRNGYTASGSTARKTYTTRDGTVTINYNYLWKPLNMVNY